MTEQTDTLERADHEIPAASSIGTAIKRLRREKGFSLQELAKASGVSVGTLSQIERDLANPSLRVLTRIRDGLGASVSALFEEAPGELLDPPFVQRASRRPKLELGHLSKELLSSGTSRSLQFMILHLEPNGSSGPTPLQYPAEKGGMVLSGKLRLKVGEEEAVLGEGDSFVFDSSIPHSFHNAGIASTRVLWIIAAVPLDRHL